MKLKSFLYTLMAVATTLVVSCQPDELSMGTTSIKPGELVEGFAYEVSHDANNPNIVYLKSLMGTQYQALWEHPQGRSQENEVTLKMPFAGTYEFTFGVMTSAGPVYASEPGTFTIEDFCSDFVSDETWVNISGGVGSSKKWYIDLDENGLSRYFAGPITFYGLDDNWDSVTGGSVGTDSSKDSWNWDASYNDVAGWQWTTELMDYGYMEFDLNNGSNVHVVANDLSYDETGLFMLNIDDPENKSITFTDVQLLHDSLNDGQVESWTGELTLLSLTENTMQIGVVRTSDPCILSLNFISEDYRNNWTPTQSNDVSFDLPEDWRDYVEQKTNKQLTFALDESDAYAWFDADGNRLDDTKVKYYDDLSFVLYMIEEGSGRCTVTSNEDEFTSTYTLNDNGYYTFDSFHSVAINDDVTLEADPDGRMYIISIETDSYSNALTDLWLGTKIYDDQGNIAHVLGYHFVLQTGGDSAPNFQSILYYFNTGWTFQNSGEDFYITGDGTYTFTINGSDRDPYGLYLDVYGVLKKFPNMDMTITSIKIDGTDIEFDDDTIDRCEGDEDNPSARRYIVNPWGATATEASKYAFTSSIEVTIYFELETGIPFIAE